MSLEIEISECIFKDLKTKLQVNKYDSEILNLAIYLKGKSDSDSDVYISTEINDFILKLLEDVYDKFGYNFSQELDLRVSLALHLIPLITRIKHKLQLKNQLLKEIKRSFPIAFDIAVYASILINEKYDTKLEEGEIAYLAIYFNEYIERLESTENKQNILLITSMKRSESVLFRQRMMRWFNRKISRIDTVNIHELDQINYDDYELFFTTEKRYVETHNAIYIDMYPQDKDYPKIKLAIDGFSNKDSILSMFDKRRFYVGNFESKSHLLLKLCEIADNKYIKKEDLYASVRLREDLGSTYFGNSIAFPHPISPISYETFATVIIPNDRVIWDDEQHFAELVILVVIEKNNIKAFQLWNYLSTLVSDKKYIENLKEKA